MSISYLCRRHQVAKPKGIAMDDFAEGKFYGVVKDWAIENKRMKLAILAAWINMGWKFGEEFLVDYPADKRRVELRWVNADDCGLEP
jgi:hypothetical protein